MNVDPVVIELLPILQDQHDGEKVPILQALGRMQRPLGNFGSQPAHQFAHGRGRDDMLGLERLCLPFSIGELNGPGGSAFVIRATGYFTAHLNLAAHLPGLVGACFPHHARAFARIAKRIDQRLNDLGPIRRLALGQKRIANGAAER